MEINLHSGQSKVYREAFVKRAGRYFVVCCSRGWGKSYLASISAVTAVSELLALPEWVPNKNVYIVAPTHDQVKDIYFPIIAYDLGMEGQAISCSRDLGRFVFPNNVELRLLSYESVERIRGKGCYFLVWDEVSSCLKGVTPREAWESVMRPAITTRWSSQRARDFGALSPGRALFISTPKGYNYFYDLFHNAETDNMWLNYQFDYRSSPYLDAEDIERERHNMDPVRFASEYLAQFKESGNSVFYCFDRTKHCNQMIPYFSAGETVHLAIDFNVGLQCTSAFAVRGHQIHVLDEFRGHPDTGTLAEAVRNKYGRDAKIVAFPDPSGKARKTSAPTGQTDFSILESFGIKCYARSKAPPIVDSVAAVNRKLLSAAGDIDLYVHPKCSGVIASLERTKWVDGRPDTAMIDKTEGVEHFSDGLRYAVEYLYPINNGYASVSRGFMF